MGISSISFEQKIWRLININVFVLKNQCKADGNPGIVFYLSTFTKETLNKKFNIFQNKCNKCKQILLSYQEDQTNTD